MMNTERRFRPEQEEDDMMIFGIRPVMEALDAGKEIERIYIQRDLSTPVSRDLKNVLKDAGISFIPVPVEKLNRLTRKNHQGVVCFLSRVTYSKVEDIVPILFETGKIPLLLVLDRITDVRNFGAICRSAECMGVDAVIIPERGASMVNGDAIKASAGALNRITICREFNLKGVLTYLNDYGIQLTGCSEKGTQNIYEADFTVPVCIVMGSEEDGISPEYLKKCDSILKIPMMGKTQSLNVSVAAGMILYEVTRQRTTR